MNKQNNLVDIGYFTNTHGIKGEIRILPKPTKGVYILPETIIYIKDKPFKILSVRPHKQYIMAFLDGINNINDIEFLKGNSVFIESEIEDAPTIVDYNVLFNGEIVGKVVSIFDQGPYNAIEVMHGDKVTSIPMVEELMEIKEESKEIWLKTDSLL